MIKKLTYIFLFIYSCSLFAQSKTDSLDLALQSAKQDTQKIKILLLIASAHGSNDPEKALIYSDKAAALCKSPGYDSTNKAYKKFTAGVYRSQGVAYYFLGDYSKALSVLQKAVAICEEINNMEGLAIAYNWIGFTHYSKGDLSKAMEAMLKSLKLQEDLGNKAGIAGATNGIANVYRAQHNLKKALEYYFITLNIRIEKNDSLHVAYTYNNIGLIYSEADSLDKSLDYHLKCMQIVEKFGDKKGMANSYGNIGEVYTKQNKYNLALTYLLKSLKLSEEISDKNGVCASYNDLGKIYYKLNDFKNAISSFSKSLFVGKEIEDKDGQKESYSGLATSYYAVGDFKNAAVNLEQFAALKDSLMNEGNGKNIEEMQTRFETEKKEKEIVLLQKDKNIRELQMSEQEANIHRQRIVMYSVIGGLVLIVVLIFFIWKSYREKKKINIGLERKNIEINVQKNLIEEKNIFITDSIDYARTIQNAILPSAEIINAHIPDSFILFLPKDIVSGDFYFIKPQGDFIFIASVDCTGHGVPGAFMSVMAFNMLENILADKKLSQPSLILDALNKMVLETLHQETENSSAKYGMDISLIAWDKKNMRLQFSGAHNSLLLISDSEEGMAELKANQTTIGMAKEKFTNHTVELQKGDMLYMFTDGYPDQKGGPQNKKFFAGEFKNILVSASKKSTTEQKEILQKIFTERKGNNEQIDDVLVIGIKV